MPRQLLAIALILIPSSLCAGERAAAKLRSPIGTVLQRNADKTWLTPILYDGVAADKPLLTLPGARGILDIAEGDIRFTLAGNLPDFSRTPVLESVVTLHKPAAGLDLDFTLNRGRVLIENHKDTGAVKARARIQGKNLDFELADKKTIVALELFSHWPAGAPFSKKPTAEQKPIGELIFLVVQGQGVLEKNGQKETLQGPALYRFDSRRGVEGPVTLKQAPDWVNPAEQQPLRIQRLQAAVEKLRHAVPDQGVLAAVAKAQQSKEIPLRVVAAYAGVALDMPAGGIAALNDAKAKEVRAAGAAALRHFIGRGNSQDMKLYETLVADKFKSGQASIVMELLHGLNPEARQRPETYDVLISYLQSDQLAIRQLAGATLAELVPQGSTIMYDAAGSAADRASAQAAWRKLIPQGQVPKMGN
jgi:hypothetical protein